MWRMFAAVLVLAAAGLCGAQPLEELVVDAETCSSAREYFMTRSPSTAVPDQPQNGKALPVCRAGRTCCTADTVLRLQQQADSVIIEQMHRLSQSYRDQFLNAATNLSDHIRALLDSSRAKTETLFMTVYQRMAVFSREPLAQLYENITLYLERDPLAEADAAPDGLPPPEDPLLRNTVNRFFAKLFPMVMSPRVRGKKDTPSRLLDPKYEDCIASKIQRDRPFGDVPERMATRLEEALGGTRLLLGVLRSAERVLNDSGRLLTDNATSACTKKLTSLWTCPRCAGLGDVLPCRDFCLNVLNGCLSRRAAEIDRVWADFVGEAATLAGKASTSPDYPGRPRSEAQDELYKFNADEAIRQMENKISEAIMYAMEQGSIVESKMKSVCGPIKWADPAAAPPPPTPPTPPTPALTDAYLQAGARSPSHASWAKVFSQTLKRLQALLLVSKQFYHKLPEDLCSNADAAAPRESQSCWNGQRIGPYTKSVVPDDKYNPEFEGDPGETPARLGLVVQQLHARTKLIKARSREDDMPREQEGSGDDDVRDIDDEDEEGSGVHVEGSGSYPGPDKQAEPIPGVPPEPVTPRPDPNGATAATCSSVSLGVITVLTVLRLVLL